MPGGIGTPRTGEVVAEYSRFLSAEPGLTVAIPTAFPAESLRIPLHEGAGVECKEGMKRNTRNRKKARAIARDLESIANHYTRVDFVHDTSLRWWPSPSGGRWYRMG